MTSAAHAHWGVGFTSSGALGPFRSGGVCLREAGWRQNWGAERETFGLAHSLGSSDSQFTPAKRTKARLCSGSRGSPTRGTYIISSAPCINRETARHFHACFKGRGSDREGAEPASLQSSGPARMHMPVSELTPPPNCATNWPGRLQEEPRSSALCQL